MFGDPTRVVDRVRRRRVDGSQATISIVPAADAGSAGLVVKTYRPRASDYGLRNELEGLRHLERIADLVPPRDGWRVVAADVVSICPTQRQITTRFVSGDRLTECRLSASDLARVEQLVCSALRMYWDRSGTIFGDLNLDNVLVDLEARSVSLIDPGAPQPTWHCPDVSDRHGPATRDAGYLLADTLSRFVHRERRTARSRRRAWRLATALLADLPSEAKVDALLCAQATLDRLLTDYPGSRRVRIAHALSTRRLRRGARRHWDIAGR